MVTKTTVIEPLIEVHTPLSVLWQIDLVETAVGAAPEVCPPGMIECFDGVILLFQPNTKPLQCIIAIIHSGMGFVVQLPPHDPLILSITLCQLSNHLHGVAAVILIGERGMLSGSMVIPCSLLTCDEDVGMIANQPYRRCCSRGTEDHFQFVPGCHCDGSVKPSKVIYSLFRFQLSPGKFCKMGELESHVRHFFQISVPLRFIPVFRIVIGTYGGELMGGEVDGILLCDGCQTHHTECQKCSKVIHVSQMLYIQRYLLPLAA